MYQDNIRIIKYIYIKEGTNTILTKTFLKIATFAIRLNKENIFHTKVLKIKCYDNLPKSIT